jgi:anthranilate/para-aminobenzoate synthase component I
MKILSTISAINLKTLPQDAAYALKDSNYLCFLDSSLIPNKYSRFSYIAWDPKLVIKSYGYKNEFISTDRKISYYSYQHPLSFLKQNIKEYTCCPPGSEIKGIDVIYIDKGRVKKATKEIEKKLPHFKGGFIGYFSYDLKNYIEELPCSAVDDINLPIFCLA